jgi:hypothetical protein
LSHNLISTAVFPTDAFSELSGDAGATAVFDAFAGVLEFEAVEFGELGGFVFVVFAGAPQADAKAVTQAINSTFLIEGFSPFTWFEIVAVNFTVFPERPSFRVCLSQRFEIADLIFKNRERNSARGTRAYLGNAFSEK